MNIAKKTVFIGAFVGCAALAGCGHKELKAPCSAFVAVPGSCGDMQMINTPTDAFDNVLSSQNDR